GGGAAGRAGALRGGGPARQPGRPAGRAGAGRDRRHPGPAGARPGLWPGDLLRPGPRPRPAVVRRRPGVPPLPGALDLRPRGLAVAALLAFGVGVTLLSCLGVLVMRDPSDRLHYTGPAAVLAPVAIAVAVALEQTLAA